jgi:hypothetical protein
MQRIQPPPISKKIGIVHKKIGTVHQKIGAKIEFGHLRFFSLHQIFEHCHPPTTLLVPAHRNA